MLQTEDRNLQKLIPWKISLANKVKIGTSVEPNIPDLAVLGLLDMWWTRPNDSRRSDQESYCRSVRRPRGEEKSLVQSRRKFFTEKCRPYVLFFYWYESVKRPQSFKDAFVIATKTETGVTLRIQGPWSSRLKRPTNFLFNCPTPRVAMMQKGVQLRKGTKPHLPRDQRLCPLTLLGALPRTTFIFSALCRLVPPPA